ncbi:MAG: hypothetical protein ACLRSW_04545 [Christensenellaceae bacterium]
MTDIVLAQLGLITTDEFLALFQTGNDDSPMMIDFERLMSHTYSYYENDEIYSFNPQLNGGEGGWLYTGFSGESFPGGLQDKDAKTLKIGCILRAKEGTITVRWTAVWLIRRPFRTNTANRASNPKS